MQLPLRSVNLGQYLRRASHALATWFPIPNIILPKAAGVDISDASVKWLALESVGEYRRVHTYGEEILEAGIVQGGIVKDVAGLARALTKVRRGLGSVTHAHAALPEEAAYVFSMQVPPDAPREQILSMIEFEFEGRVPIPPSAAVYDYSPIKGNVIGEIGVVVFPRDLAEAYADAFSSAGITLLSLEVEARSIARAVSKKGADEPVTLIVDFGRARSGFAVVKSGIPIFTSTVEVGGDMITHSLMEKMSMTAEEASEFKNTKGLMADAKSEAMQSLTGTASALSDEVKRHYHYWDTRRDEHGERMTPVGRIVLVGGNANIRGLDEYIAGRVQAEVDVGNVWANVASFDDYIPPIEQHESLQYATAIGLALRGI